MRARVLAVTVVVLGLFSAGCGGDAAPAANGGSDGGSDGGSAAGGGFRELKACELLTLDDAKKILGDDAVHNERGDSAGISSAEVTVSMCQYYKPDLSRFASVLVRAPLTEGGAASNEDAFEFSRPTGAVDVSGYGDQAYYDPGLGSFSVLANRVYLVFGGGLDDDGNPDPLENGQAVADIVLPRLN